MAIEYSLHIFNLIEKIKWNNYLMTDIENCPKCHKPLRTENTDASLTQWIFGRDSCKCEVLSEIEASKVAEQQNQYKKCDTIYRQRLV